MLERSTTFTSGSQHLAGTFCAPDGATGLRPGVLLLTGSGPLDRDGNHKRLRIDVSRQLAHALAQAGIVSLRFDKRGVGESPGDWRAAGLWDNVADAQGALAHLAADPGVDAGQLVVVGHSEGAVQAAALAAEAPELAGVVLLSGAARRGQDVLLWQAETIVPTLPAPVRALLRLLRVDTTAKVAANHAKILATTDDVVRLNGARTNAKWFREYLVHDPCADLSRIRCPLLAITGEKDLQVDPADLDVIKEVTPEPVDTHRLADVTHLLRRQEKPASMSRYKEEVKRPVDPEVLRLVTQWVVSTAGG